MEVDIKSRDLHPHLSSVYYCTPVRKKMSATGEKKKNENRECFVVHVFFFSVNLLLLLLNNAWTAIFVRSHMLITTTNSKISRRSATFSINKNAQTGGGGHGMLEGRQNCVTRVTQ